MSEKKITKEEHNRLLNQYLISDKKLYMYGQKEFGFIFKNARIDVTIEKVIIKEVLSINGFNPNCFGMIKINVK